MKERLQQLISQNKIKQAIQELLKITKDLGAGSLQEEVALQSAQYEQYAKEKRLGTSTNEEQNIASNKINQALLHIISQLSEGGSSRLEGPHSSAKKKNWHWWHWWHWWQWGASIGVIIGILAGIAEFSGYSLKDLFGKGRVTSFSVTVLVHGKEGRDDRILRNQGKVVLDIGTARQEASINEKGEATFKELPMGYAGEKVLISIDHPQPYFPKNRDTEYILENGKVIYLEVELKGINKIQGRVLNYETEKPLDSVRVSHQNIATFSNKFGWYELNIPPDKQAKFIRVNFFKDGYIMEDIDSIAPHTQQEIGISLKKQ